MSNVVNEEKLQILKMIEEGKVSAKEGISLLDALETKEPIVANKNAKWLKIRVYDPEDETKVHVTLPIALVHLGLKFATKFSPELKDTGLNEVDFKEIVEAVKQGAEGKIVDVTTEKNGEKVEIYVE